MTIELENGTRVHRSRIKLPYNWWLGEIGSRFYANIRDHRKITGIRCPQCRLVFVPPKANCPKCFSRMEEWVELKDTGILINFTIVRYRIPSIQPMEPPFALGIIQLEGADTGVMHLLGEVDFKELRLGMKVKAVFSEARKGHLLDIKYFKAVTE